MSQAFCDADSLATWLFNWAAGCLLLGFLTVVFMNAYRTKKEIASRQGRYNNEVKQVNEILDEIRSMQQLARQEFEEASTSHDKAKAMYAYERISDCLNRFQIIKVEE